MAENAATVNAADIVAKAQYALDNGWGYIWGASGQIWTQASQDSATREMTVRYGQKWVGKHVVDCSGLFYWAFKQLGGFMYHGSNTMYKSYCTSKGKLSGGKRTDGQTLFPGTAIFTGTEDSHGHVGMYVGNGYVIEAKGTQAGVVKTPITDKRWTYWGELKGCNYGTAPAPTPPAPTPTPEKGYAIVTGKNLALREGPGTDCRVLTRVETGNKVKIETIPADWEYVSYNGKTGFMMKKFLNEG